MKTVFFLINLVIGVLCLLFGVANFENLGNNLGSAIAGAVVVLMGAACLWLAEETSDDAPWAV